MRILVASELLDGIGGAETYTLTVADHLERLGHDVWLLGLELGGAATRAQATLGLRVLGPGDPLPDGLEVALTQDAVVATHLAGAAPDLPQVQVLHSDLYDKYMTAPLPGQLSAVVALYDRLEERARAMAVAPEIVRLTQPIDTERYKPLRALPQRPAVALLLGNYVHGQRLELLRRACERAGVELRHIGQFGTADGRDGALVLNDADIVFGKARVIHEAMACGRAAYVFDHNGADGWVTAESYPRLVADNFGGQSGHVVDEDRLAAELARYDPAMGLVNRDLIVAHHGATRHAAALVEVLRRAASPAPQGDVPLDEVGRLLRVNTRAEGTRYHLQVEVERLHARLAAAEAVAATRRWRALQRVLAPWDRLRGRR